MVLVWEIALLWELIKMENELLIDVKIGRSRKSLRHLQYMAIISDLLLRFGWALNIALLAEYNNYSDIIVSITSLLECFRRFVWNFFRLENEHVNNVGRFRAVRDIDLRPLRNPNAGAIGQKVIMLFGSSPPSSPTSPSFEENLETIN